MAWALDMDLVDTEQPLSGEMRLLVAIWQQLLKDAHKGESAVQQEARAFLRTPSTLAYWSELLDVDQGLLERHVRGYVA